MIYFKKMINNNVALVETSKGNEYVVIGKGIAFNRKKDDIIDEKKIEKFYSLSEEENKMLVDYLKDIDYKMFVIADQVKKLVEETCELQYTNYMYLSLIDHISGSITRMKMGIDIDSEVPKQDLQYYTREYELAQKTNDIIQTELGIRFNDNELSFLVLHYIGLLYDLKYTQINEKVNVITSDILEIVGSDIGYDKMQGFAVERFIVHLKFFIVRQFNKDEDTNITKEYNAEMYRFLTAQHQDAEKVLLKVIKYLESNYEFKVSLDEWLYLLIHIVKILK